jgi:hypothetical protein
VTFETEEGNGTVVTPQPVLTDADGEASVSWELPSESGDYTLTASVPAEDNPPGDTDNPPAGNVASFPDVAFDPQSLSFTATVGTSEVPLALNVATVERLPGGTQHFVVQSGAPGPYIWSVNGIDGGNATFGTIAANPDFTADYTAPAAVPTPATFNVCARRQANPSNSACASVTIQPVPSSGADVIVFNDVNVFDNTAAQDPSNVQLFKNLVNFTATGPRGSGGSVLIHQGHGSLCLSTSLPTADCTAIWTSFVSTMTGEDYSVAYADDQTAPLTTIASDVKVVILALPMQAYSNSEVNSLKAFAGEGGRIVFVGEWDGFYGDGINIENDFLVKMGAEMQNTGGAVNCGYTTIPQSSLRPHQVTTDLTQLTIGCASVVDPGPNDYPLFYDTTGELVLGAVAKVSVAPLVGPFARALGVASAVAPAAKIRSAMRSRDPVGRELKAREGSGNR